MTDQPSNPSESAAAQHAMAPAHQYAMPPAMPDQGMPPLAPPPNGEATRLRTRIDDIADALRAAPGGEAALRARLLAQRAARGTEAAVRGAHGAGTAPRPADGASAARREAREAEAAPRPAGNESIAPGATHAARAGGFVEVRDSIRTGAPLHAATVQQADAPRAAALPGGAARAESLAQSRAARAAPARPTATDDEAFVPDFAPCDIHGPYPINLRDTHGVLRYLPPHCPGCHKQKAADRLLRRAAIAPRFAGCSFDNFVIEAEKQQATFDICRGYARDFARVREAGTCLILRGNPGTGKNHLASAIAQSVLARGLSVANATANEIIRRIRETWKSTSGETEEAVTREFAALDLLIIDEVGRQYTARDGNESLELFSVIDQRYRRVAPTVIISNCNRDELREALGHAAFDRLREGGGQMANFDWDTYRK